MKNSDDGGFGTFSVSECVNSGPSFTTTFDGLGNSINSIINSDWKCTKMTKKGLGRDLVVRSCVPNVAGLIKDGCIDGTQGFLTFKNCYCSTDLCNSSNSIGILNISFFSFLALFYFMN